MSGAGGSSARGGGIPRFMIGMAIAVAAETSIGLLIYQAPGLLDALTVVVGVQLAGLVAGLATSPGGRRTGGRWRWFFATGAFGIAGAASVAWTLDADFMASWATRGMSLTVLAGLPMYGCGLLLSAIPGQGDDRRSGVPVLVGALAGVGLIGGVLFDRFEPFGLWLFGIFSISVAAFLTGVQAAIEAREAVARARAEAVEARMAEEAERAAADVAVYPREEALADSSMGPAVASSPEERPHERRPFVAGPRAGEEEVG